MVDHQPDRPRMEESWFTRELGSVPLYRVSQSQSLSLKLDQETPNTLRDTRVIETDVIQLGSEGARARMKRMH